MIRRRRPNRKDCIATTFLLVAITAPALTAAQPATADFYVAPAGNDANPGTGEEPPESRVCTTEKVGSIQPILAAGCPRPR
jgi:hypothetical protein